MATVVNSIIAPDPSAIAAHLEAIFAPCRGDYPNGLIELRFGREAPNQSAYFNLQPNGVQEAAAFASKRNSEGANVYFGPNPRKPTTKGTASDTDVQCAFWHFADLDDADAVEMVGKRIKALPPTLTVTTGSEPHRRPHLYWQLEEPVGNMPAWTELQRGIAATLDGDAVINPSRIMRLAGTVNFPPPHKLQRGYRVELTSLRTAFSDERSPVTSGQIADAYPVRATISKMETVQPGQNTLQAMRPTRVADLLAACRNGDQWHNSMVRLVAHLVSTGRTNAEIMGLADHITLAGFTVANTEREMGTALVGARVKWAIPEPQDDVQAEEATREDGDSFFQLLDLDELENMPPPEWLIDELIVSDGLTVIYGDPGTGKSFIALDMAIRLAMGMDWHGKEAKQCGVLYIAGEGARGLGKRVKGWRREHALEGVDAPFMLLPVPVALLEPAQRAKLLRTIDEAKRRAGFDINMVVVDTVSRALQGAGENGADEMGAFVAACDQVRMHTGGAVLGVHHSGKNKEAGMRGSTVLLGACDGTIRVDKSGELVTLKTEKQKDAEEAAPIYMEMKKVEWCLGLEKPQSTLVPFRREAQPMSNDISREQIRLAFGYLVDMWASGRPLSHQPRTIGDGRYAPRILSGRFGGDPEAWTALIQSWLENGNLSVEIANSNTKLKGLCVLDAVL